MSRKLAHIEEISDITKIEGADNIALATVLGWKVIINKNEFKIGDPCVFLKLIQYFQMMTLGMLFF